jgi:hypothetical protein
LEVLSKEEGRKRDTLMVGISLGKLFLEGKLEELAEMRFK